ncbi:unnamed protein product [Ceratitis capitata]|uniref:(Mediterranean fruit fly) hypothetical protein n=1 Tax=Ceratitis capitata TaxID=7213 RepID=A0A811UXJ8_CERCA|nr:unnamed protein product [Ceratitis capitata]
MMWKLSWRRSHGPTKIRYINYFWLLEFINRDLVAVLLLTEDGKKANIVVSSVHFPVDSNIISTPVREHPNNYCKKEHLPLVIGYDAKDHDDTLGSTN